MAVGIVGTVAMLVGPGVIPAYAQCDLSYDVSISDARRYEGTGPGTVNFVFTITQTGCIYSVDYATSNGTATQPADYTQKSGTVSLQGFTNTITVPVVRDSLDEPNETFTVTLSNPKGSGGVSIGDGTGIGRILDDDGPPTINIDDASVQEGPTQTNMNFKVTISKPQPQAVTFSATTWSGSATASGPNADYVALNNQPFTLPAGKSFVLVPVKVKGDNQSPQCSATDPPDQKDQGVESLFVQLTSPTNATIADGWANGSIEDWWGFCPFN